MSAPYIGNPNVFNPNISIFTEMDLVLGGLDQSSNIPVQELADNSAYLKKFKGNVLTGSGAPTDAVFPPNFVIDSNTNNNTLYFDQITGSFWKRIGTNSWENIGKGAVLNVKGLRINNAGDDTDNVYLKYDAATKYLELRNAGDTAYADLRVGTLAFESADGTSVVTSQFVDKEILILSKIANASENSDGFFSVKSLTNKTGNILQILVNAISGFDRFILSIPPTGIAVGDYIQIYGVTEGAGEHINKLYKVLDFNNLVAPFYITINRAFTKIDALTNKTGSNLGNYAKDNAAQLRWDNANSRFELRRRDGTLMPINISTFFINGAPIEFIANRVITRTLEFDDIFNCSGTNYNATTNECYLRTPESGYVNSMHDEYVFIKKNINTLDGSYTLNRMVVIEGNNLKIEFAPGVIINFNDPITGVPDQPGNFGFRHRDYTDLPITQYQYTAPDNFMQVLANDYYFSSGQEASSTTVLPSFESGTKLFAFSDVYTMSKKFTVVSNDKELRHVPLIAETRDVTYDFTGPYDVAYKKISGVDRAFIAKKKGSSPPLNSQIDIYSPQIDFDDGTIVSSVDTQTIFLNSNFDVDELKWVFGDTRGVLVASKHIPGTGFSALCYIEVDLTNVSVVITPRYSVVADFSFDNLRAINGCIVNDSDLYIVGNQSEVGNVSVFRAILSLAPSLNPNLDKIYTTNINQDPLIPLQSMGCVTDGTLVYMSYGYINQSGAGGGVATHYLAIAAGTGIGTWTNHRVSPTGDPYAGIYSEMAIEDTPYTGGKLLHIASTSGPATNKTQNLNVTIVDSSNAYSFVKNSLSGGLTGEDFTSISLYKNIYNTYRSCTQFVVSAIRGTAPSVQHTYTYLNNFGSSNLITPSPIDNSSIRGKIIWSGGNRTSPLLKTRFIGGNNNGCFISGKDSFDDILFFQHVNFVHTIPVLETLPSGIDLSTNPVIISNDFIENSEIVGLKINQLGDTIGPEIPPLAEPGPTQFRRYHSYVELGNTINCKVAKLAVINGKYKTLLMGSVFSRISPTPWVGDLYTKAFHTTIDDTWIDSSNYIVDEYFSHFNGGDFRNFYLGQISPITKKFNSCVNISISGLMDAGDNYFGTGDFDI